MIEIVMKNGDMITYKPEDYTDYHYDRKFFIVTYNKQWIGMYNCDSIEYVEIHR